jgi:hypothetical protein
MLYERDIQPLSKSGRNLTAIRDQISIHPEGKDNGGWPGQTV